MRRSNIRRYQMSPSLAHGAEQLYRSLGSAAVDKTERPVYRQRSDHLYSGIEALEGDRNRACGNPRYVHMPSVMGKDA